ncbi:hypothetical protein PF005_g942 [Phytophthora fragariae]|uniref:Uncharacterized protein n=1 Tax=Phytophthora fragariae TaxID=53985 RepID=A0A6A3T3M9_9STRA|nr:hypothetical protein PF009_g4985 [Phytophthora fragariae]KAE9129443.1 hypothetical protein PF007_g4889 [Phytophthora fragariae]KAE9137173.1 hypothetical protein PF010_g1407 [Phytophthora fragariae]KAE9154570.1 hypothetical protein PF006_g1400 [Phytophthora fragariae]KAE9236684.1 hypothetical protein PF005_g942 [Phytophthora fragariae]
MNEEGGVLTWTIPRQSIQTAKVRAECRSHQIQLGATAAPEKHGGGLFELLNLGYLLRPQQHCCYGSTSGDRNGEAGESLSSPTGTYESSRERKDGRDIFGMHQSTASTVIFW